MNTILGIIKRLSPNKYIAKTDKTELENLCKDLDSQENNKIYILLFSGAPQI